MDLSNLVTFFKILNESINIIRKTWKFMLPIASISSIITSILFLLFIFSIQHLKQHPNTSNELTLKHWPLLLAISIALAISFYAISLLSTEATVLASAMSYRNEPLSFQKLFSEIKKAGTRPFRTTINISYRTAPYFLLISVLTNLLLMHPNPITIGLWIFLLIAISIYLLYLTVAWTLAIVLSLIEDGFYGKKAVERALQLVEGESMNGFMLILLNNLLVLIIFMVYWMIFGYRRFGDMTMHGIVVVNAVTLVRVFILAAYTVFYFECKNHCEDIENIHYVKLSSDIPRN